MVAVEIAYTRVQRLWRSIVTVGLLAAGFYVLFFGSSQKIPVVSNVSGEGGVAHAEVTGDVASDSCDSCGSDDGDCGSG